MRLRPRLKTILEAEGVLIDPVGAMLAALVLQVVLVPAASTLTAELVAFSYRVGLWRPQRPRRRSGFGGGRCGRDT
jgi:NhaP-type Na+/H+ or K+/H+ antiporter